MARLNRRHCLYDVSKMRILSDRAQDFASFAGVQRAKEPAHATRNKRMRRVAFLRAGKRFGETHCLLKRGLSPLPSMPARKKTPYMRAATPFLEPMSECFIKWRFHVCDSRKGELEGASCHTERAAQRVDCFSSCGSSTQPSRTRHAVRQVE